MTLTANEPSCALYHLLLVLHVSCPRSRPFHEQRIKNIRTSPEEAEAEQLADLGISPSPALTPGVSQSSAAGNPAGSQVTSVTAGSPLVHASPAGAEAAAGTGASGDAGGAPEVDLLGLMGGDDIRGAPPGKERGGNEFQKGSETGRGEAVSMCSGTHWPGPTFTLEFGVGVSLYRGRVCARKGRETRHVRDPRGRMD